MPEGCCNHARNGGSRFEKDDSLVKQIGLSHGADVETGGDIQRATESDPYYIRLPVIVEGSWKN